MPVLDAWREEEAPRFPSYDAGTFGPRAADQLLENDGREWRSL